VGEWADYWYGGEEKPCQVDPDEAGRATEHRQLVCPGCGSNVEEDSIWARYGKFYCTEKCAKKADQPKSVLSDGLIEDWTRTIRVELSRKALPRGYGEVQATEEER
jgi:hypothetical protein